MTGSGIAALERLPTKSESESRHYLEAELYDLAKRDSGVFDFLQGGSLDGIWYWDLENPEHEWMSPRLWEVLGYDPADQPHLASAWQDVIDPHDLQVAIASFERHRDDPSHPYDEVVRYAHKDGSTVWIRCRGVVIRDEAGKPVRMLGAHTDVTALKRTEERLRQKALQLESVNTDLSLFAYAASHDLRSPLSSIHGLVEHLIGHHAEGLAPDGREALHHLRDTASRALELMDRVLQFSKVAGSELNVEAIDPGELIDQVRTDLCAAIDSTGATFDLRELPTIWADRAHVRHLLQNLISNAIRFVEDGTHPHVKVRGFVEPEVWRFEIEDNGIGIAAEDLGLVFDPFQRLQSGSGESGTGLGLALAKRVVLMHGGEIWMTSELGRGTTVHFTLSKDAG